MTGGKARPAQSLSVPVAVPADARTERAVLGAVLVDPGVFPRVAAIVGAADFGSNATRAVFEAFERLTDRGVELDLGDAARRLLRSLRRSR